MADHRGPATGPEVRDGFPDEVTQPLRFALSVENTGQPKCNGLFERLADALGLSENAVEHLTSELLVHAEATPATLTAAQLWNMRSGLLALVDSVLPAATRESTRSRLLIFMLEVAPLNHEGG